MTGIFSPQFVQGSSLQGESYVGQPVKGADVEIAKTAIMANNAIQYSLANRAVSKQQEKFLSDLEANRQDLAAKSDLEKSSAQIDVTDPEGKALFDKAQGDIKTLQDAMNSRNIDPIRAQAEIDKIKRKYMARAPGFAYEISRLSGAKGSTFEAETEMMIKNRQRLAGNMVDAGYNPEDPNQVDDFLEMQRTIQTAQYQAAQDKIVGRNVYSTSLNLTTSLIGTETSRLNNLLQQNGVVSATELPSEVKQAYMNDLERMSNGGEVQAVQELVTRAYGGDTRAYSTLSQEQRNNLEGALKGYAETQRRILSGETRKISSENLKEALSNEVWTTVAKNHPNTFAAMTISNSLKDSVLASQGIKELTAGAVRDILLNDLEFKDWNKNTIDNMSRVDGDKKKAAEAQKMYAKINTEVLSDTIDNIEKGIESKEDVLLRSEALEAKLEALSANPTQYHPAVFDDSLAWITSPQYTEYLSKIDPKLKGRIMKKAARAIIDFTAENTIPDMNNQLNRKVFTEYKPNATAKDLVSVVVEKDGSVNFVPNTGFEYESDAVKAQNEATRLNSLYRNRSIQLADAYTTLSGDSELTSEQKINRTIKLYQNGLDVIDEPLRSIAEDVDTPLYNEAQFRAKMWEFGVATGWIGDDGFMMKQPPQQEEEILAKKMSTEKLRASILEHYRVSNPTRYKKLKEIEKLASQKSEDQQQ